MTQLIDKSPIVAEIEKQIEFGKFKCQQSQENNDRESYVAWSEHIATCGKILSFIDTLEVKEVDLEKYYHDFLQKEWFDKNCCRTISEMMAFTAKHFFELGMRFSAIGSDYIEGVRGYYETTTK